MILKKEQLQQIKRMEGLNCRYMRGVPFVKKRYTKEVSLLSKMVYKNKRLDFGAEPPRTKPF